MCYDNKITYKQIVYDGTISRCPFCNGVSWMNQDTYFQYFYVICGNCHAIGPRAEDPGMAATLWSAGSVYRMSDTR